MWIDFSDYIVLDLVFPVDFRVVVRTEKHFDKAKIIWLITLGGNFLKSYALCININIQACIAKKVPHSAVPTMMAHYAIEMQNFLAKAHRIHHARVGRGVDMLNWLKS